MRQHRRPATIISLLIIVLLMAALGSGCFASPDPGPAVGTPVISPASGTLRLYGEEPLTLDPATSQDVSSWEYLLHLYDGLVGLDEDLEVRPAIASSWDTSPDGLVYTFSLRQGVKFHSGREVTAHDFKYSLERACDPQLRSPVASLYLGDIVGARDKLAGQAPEIAGVVVKDDYTLEITIDSPKQYFLAKLTYPTACAVDQANAEMGADWWRQPNGTGPFKMKEWAEDEQIVLERNELYYGQQPSLQEVRFHLGGGSPMGMYEQGQLDIIEVGLADIDRATDPKGPLAQELQVEPMLSLFYIGMHTETPPFDDVKVRQAMTVALDREKITSVLLKGYFTPAKGILPPGMPGYNEQLEGLAYDAEQARQLIEESSYGSVANLPPITFTVTAGGGGLASSFAQIYEQVLGLDIAVLEVDDADDFYSDLDAGNLQMFSLGWVADYPDPQNFLDILFHSQSQGNNTAYHNAQMDALLDQASVEAAAEKRMNLYHEAEQIIVDEAPVIPLYHNTSYRLVKPYVKGLTITPMGVLSLNTVAIDSSAN